MRLFVHTAASISAPRQGARPALLVQSLDLMLIDSVLEHIALARRGMNREGSCEKDHLLSAAVQIVGELRSSLDLYASGPHAANLDDLCDYMSRQLVAANAQNRVATLDEVADLLREARSAWMMVPYV
jgi:flagellar protein FliS